MCKPLTDPRLHAIRNGKMGRTSRTTSSSLLVKSPLFATSPVADIQRSDFQEAENVSSSGEKKLTRLLSDLHLFDHGQIELKSSLGSGSFCTVYAAKLRSRPHEVLPLLGGEEGQEEKVDSKIDPEDSTNSTDKDLTENIFSETSRTVETPSNIIFARRWAVKRVSQDILEKKDEEDNAQNKLLLEEAESALMQEAFILASTPRHQNIITLLGISNDLLDTPKEGFIVMERLGETLQQRLTKWKLHAKSRHNPTKQFLQRNRKSAIAAEQCLRMRNCALGIASGMRHLHSHQIIYRDLKPSNIGFSREDGTVRIFDFGLAKRYSSESSGRKLTKGCGSVRYMSPEVASKDDYCLSADVYSFSLVLWEICCLQKPYGDCYNFQTWFERVVRKGKRPSLRCIAQKEVQELLTACWNQDTEARPTFALITAQLKTILVL